MVTVRIIWDVVLGLGCSGGCRINACAALRLAVGVEGALLLWRTRQKLTASCFYTCTYITGIIH
eukprot:5885931-Ditylum_brightwellii.AAC.1